MHQGTVMTIFIGAHTLACALIGIYMSLSLDCPSDPLSWVFKVLVASPRPGIETEVWLLTQGTLPSCRARIPTQPYSLCPPQMAWFGTAHLWPPCQLSFRSKGWKRHS